VVSAAISADLFGSVEEFLKVPQSINLLALESPSETALYGMRNMNSHKFI
jgi:hypothetical protein